VAVPQKSKPRKMDRRVPRARQLRRAMTDAERKLWWHLRALLGKEFHFRRQATIGPYFVDFACHQKRIVIEVDGSQHMALAGPDAARTAFLQSRGYRVLRFWNNEVLQQTEGVLAAIHEAPREDRGSSPHP
jgi:very-short-patch-repair endonuclease